MRLNSVYAFYARYCARPGLLRFNRFLFNLSLRGMGIYNSQSYEISGERNFIDHLANSGEDGLIVFDVGANCGDYTRLLLEKIGTIKAIYCFEPHPGTYEALKENLVNYNCAKTFNVALSSGEGLVELYDYQDQKASKHASLSSEIFASVYKKGKRSFRVQCTTIDNFVAEFNIPKIDLLKIDVEGFELQVLQGAEKTLSEKKVKRIQFEFTQLNSSVGVFFKELYDLLSSDYKIFRLLPKSFLDIKEYNPTLLEIFGYQNYVAQLKE